MVFKRRQLKKSIQYSFSIITGLSTLSGLWGYAIKDIHQQWQWWKWGIVLFLAFAALTTIFFIYYVCIRHRTYITTIHGVTVEIKQGDIFEENGWKLIPFNDIDTKVDDIIVAHNSLNGKMIDSHVDSIDDLTKTIESAKEDSSKLSVNYIDGKATFPLGRIIPFEDYLMLSFSHFDNQNRAYLNAGEYELMLIRMWNEMRRVYAAKHITIPLLGTGITSIEGMTEKNYTAMLKCILCTLNASSFRPMEGISIVITEEVMQKIDMNTIRDEF